MQQTALPNKRLETITVLFPAEDTTKNSRVYRISNMGKSPCRRSAEGFDRGAWTAEEDMILSKYIGIHGDRAWKNLLQKAGLRRCGKSCRLRWLNYLRPDINHGNITPDEEDLIIRMHRLLGNRWSLIAGRLPGRTDNKIKNYWNTYLCKKVTVSESQLNTQIPKKESITSPSPVQNHMFKPKPVKITSSARHSEMVRPTGCNGSGSNHSSDEAAFKLYNVKETTNSSKSVWCDLLDENSKTDDESEHVALAMADVILVGAEVTNSARFMSYLADEQSSDSECFSATLAQSLVLFNELSSPDYNLLSYSSDCSLTDFGLGELYKGAVRFAAERSEFEVISSMQPVNSFTFAEGLGWEELYNNRI